MKTILVSFISILVCAASVLSDTGQEQITTPIAATTAGTVPAGARTIIFIAPSGVTGTIAGAPFVASERRVLAAQSGDTLGPVPYTVSGGTLYVTVLQRR